MGRWKCASWLGVGRYHLVKVQQRFNATQNNKSPEVDYPLKPEQGSEPHGNVMKNILP
jgi:hypothetical protein